MRRTRDLAVVLHELGRQVTPSPVLASCAGRRGGVDRGAERVDSSPICCRAWPPGELIADGRPEQRARLLRLLAVHRALVGRRAAASVLDGAARFVLDAHVADWLVVAATDDAGARHHGAGRARRAPA